MVIAEVLMILGLAVIIGIAGYGSYKLGQYFGKKSK